MENAIIGLLFIFSISMNIYYAAMLIPLLKSDKNFYRNKTRFLVDVNHLFVKELSVADKSLSNARKEIKELEKIILGFDPGFEFGMSN